MTRERNVSRWYGNLLKPGDSYLLHGIDVELATHCECHPNSEDFIIPHLNDLIATAQAHPESHEMQWLEEDKKWVAILPNLNQA